MMEIQPKVCPNLGEKEAEIGFFSKFLRMMMEHQTIFHAMD